MIIYDILINVVTNYNSKSLSFTLLLRRGNCIAICHNVFLCFNQKLPRHCMCLNLCIEFCNRINFPLLLTLIILWQVPYFILLIHSLRQMFSHVGISGQLGYLTRAFCSGLSIQVPPYINRIPGSSRCIPYNCSRKVGSSTMQSWIPAWGFMCLFTTYLVEGPYFISGRGALSVKYQYCNII